MSAFKQSMGKLGLRAGVLAGASAAVLAISGLGAGSAMAAPTCPEGQHIKGMGSSLQKTAQEIWTGRKVATVTEPSQISNEGEASSFSGSYRAACASKTTPPVVDYGSSGSGKGIAAFGYNGGSVNKELAFVGTDDGPNATQIANAESAGGTQAVILPVSQTAIAIVVHLPTGCTLSGITWTDLNKVWGGNEITTWRQFSTASSKTEGGPCDHKITRVVRAEGSGTSLQFKNYLQTLHEGESAAKLPCSTEGTEEWSGLEEVGAAPAEKPNTVWPTCTGSTTVVTAAGGGAVAEKVDLTENTIGYAALPDAEAHLTHGASLAKLENGTPGGIAHFESPANTTTSNARCENSRYTVESKGIRGAAGGGLSVNWSKVFGAVPKIGGTEYPLCTLTYVTAWNEYTEANSGPNHATIQALVKDYIQNYVLGEGQTSASGHWYAPLPEGEGPGTSSDVKDSAAFIAENL
jgi:ABC-type phosphate transport system substrate-binding protein